MYPVKSCLIPIALLALMFAGLCGCSIKADGLAPEQPVTTSRHIRKIIKIMPVEGGYASSFGREAYITNEQFGAALHRTLSESGLFTDVISKGSAPYNLHSEIITISTEGGLSPFYAIVVQYWLIDSATGDEVWRKGINTRHQVMWNEAFAGATRIIRAVEGATQKNLAQLVVSLEKAEVFR